MEPTFVSEKRWIIRGPTYTFCKLIAAKAPYLSIHGKKREASPMKKRFGHSSFTMNKFCTALRFVAKFIYGKGPNSAANSPSCFKNECFLSCYCKFQCRHKSRRTGSYNDYLFFHFSLRFKASNLTEAETARE